MSETRLPKTYLKAYRCVECGKETRPSEFWEHLRESHRGHIEQEYAQWVTEEHTP